MTCLKPACNSHTVLLQATYAPWCTIHLSVILLLQLPGNGFIIQFGAGRRRTPGWGLTPVWHCPAHTGLHCEGLSQKLTSERSDCPSDMCVGNEKCTLVHFNHTVCVAQSRTVVSYMHAFVHSFLTQVIQHYLLGLPLPQAVDVQRVML